MEIKKNPDIATGPDRDPLNYRQAAQALGICERSVFTLVKSGQLHAFRAGRSVRIPHEAVEAFKARGGSTPNKGDDHVS